MNLNDDGVLDEIIDPSGTPTIGSIMSGAILLRAMILNMM
jgi:hypothetical protein